MAIADGHGLPIGISIVSATPHEAKLVETTIESVYTPYLPKRLIGGKAYDSDKLDEIIRERYGIDVIAPERLRHKMVGVFVVIGRDGR